MSPSMTACWKCGQMRWAGLGPCSSCGADSPEYVAETIRINEARADAGLPPLSEAVAFTTKDSKETR